MIKRIVITTFSLLICFSSGAESWDHCSLQVSHFGSGNGKSVFDDSCRELVKKSSPNEAQYIGKNFSVYAYENVVVVEKKNGSKLNTLLAGEMTRLRNISSITVDEDKAELYVLLSDGIVHFYSLNMLGNVAPMRVLKTDEVYGAKDILVHGGLLYILNPKSSKVIAYSSKANSEAPKSLTDMSIKLRKEQLNPNPKSLKIVERKNQESFVVVTFENGDEIPLP